MRKWRIEDSAEIYNIHGWGLDYFSINDKGHAQVTPAEGGCAVDLQEVMEELKSRDVCSMTVSRRCHPASARPPKNTSSRGNAS